jgi:hypothetical protein
LQWPPMTQLQYQVSLKIDETLSELEYWKLHTQDMAAS